jgi:zinc protease
MNTVDPEYYKKDLKNIQAVTMEEVKNAYEKYIKGKNFVETSFVPKGEVSPAVEGSENAGIVEEDVTKAAEVKTEAGVEEPIIKTKTKLDRSVKPAVGPDPEVTIPKPWSGSLSNGMKIWGIQQTELPLIQYSIVIDGGQILDPVEKAGLTNLVATMLNEGTRNKAPEELEDAIGLLGASIRVSSGEEDISINVGTLTKNFEKTIALVEEMLLEPRWDEEQFALAKSRIINGLKRNARKSETLGNLLDMLNTMTAYNLPADFIKQEETFVKGLTTNEVLEYVRKYIDPARMYYVVVGDAKTQLKPLEAVGLGKPILIKD